MRNVIRALVALIVMPTSAMAFQDQWQPSSRSLAEYVADGYVMAQPGLFNALYSPVYDRLTAGSSAAFHRALAMFARPFALMILRA